MSDELKAVLICVIILPLTLLLKKFFEDTSGKRNNDKTENDGDGVTKERKSEKETGTRHRGLGGGQHAHTHTITHARRDIDKICQLPSPPVEKATI